MDGTGHHSLGLEGVEVEGWKGGRLRRGARFNCGVENCEASGSNFSAAVVDGVAPSQIRVPCT